MVVIYRKGFGSWRRLCIAFFNESVWWEWDTNPWWKMSAFGSDTQPYFNTFVRTWLLINALKSYLKLEYLFVLDPYDPSQHSMILKYIFENLWRKEKPMHECVDWIILRHICQMILKLTIQTHALSNMSNINFHPTKWVYKYSI